MPPIVHPAAAAILLGGSAAVAAGAAARYQSKLRRIAAIREAAVKAKQAGVAPEAAAAQVEAGIKKPEVAVAIEQAERGAPIPDMEAQLQGALAAYVRTVTDIVGPDVPLPASRPADSVQPKKPDKHPSGTAERKGGGPATFQTRKSGPLRGVAQPLRASPRALGALSLFHAPGSFGAYNYYFGSPRVGYRRVLGSADALNAFASVPSTDALQRLPSFHEVAPWTPRASTRVASFTKVWKEDDDKGTWWVLGHDTGGRIVASDRMRKILARKEAVPALAVVGARIDPGNLNKQIPIPARMLKSVFDPLPPAWDLDSHPRFRNERRPAQAGDAAVALARTHRIELTDSAGRAVETTDAVFLYDSQGNLLSTSRLSKFKKRINDEKGLLGRAKNWLDSAREIDWGDVKEAAGDVKGAIGGAANAVINVGADIYGMAANPGRTLSRGVAFMEGLPGNIKRVAEQTWSGIVHGAEEIVRWLMRSVIQPFFHALWQKAKEFIPGALAIGAGILLMRGVPSLTGVEKLANPLWQSGFTGANIGFSSLIGKTLQDFQESGVVGQVRSGAAKLPGGRSAFDKVWNNGIELPAKHLLGKGLAFAAGGAIDQFLATIAGAGIFSSLTSTIKAVVEIAASQIIRLGVGFTLGKKKSAVTGYMTQLGLDQGVVSKLFDALTQTGVH